MSEEHKNEMLQIFRRMLQERNIFIFEKRRTGKALFIYHIKVYGIHQGVWDFTPLMLHLLNVKGDDLRIYSKLEFVKQVCKAIEALGYPRPDKSYETISDNVRWLE